MNQQEPTEPTPLGGDGRVGLSLNAFYWRQIYAF